MEFITDLKAIRREIGLRLEESTLYPKLNLDAYKDVTPVLLKEGKRYLLLAKEVEKGNFTPGGPAAAALKKNRLKVLYYSSYFTWDRQSGKKAVQAVDEAEALHRAFPERTALTVYPDMALERYRRLGRRFSLSLAVSGRKGKTWVYGLEPKRVDQAFGKDRPILVRFAERVLKEELRASAEEKSWLRKLLRRPPSRRFAVLDELLRRGRVKNLLASSPINIQEMTGRPRDRIGGGLLSLYREGEVFLLSPRRLNLLRGMKGLGSSPSLKEALDHLAPGQPLGVEEKNLDIGRALALGLDRLEDASNLFRSWREVRSGEDLGAYILAARGTKFAMEGALALAGKKIREGRPVSEKDVERSFYRLLRRFAGPMDGRLRLRPYFMVLHCGRRTPYPSLPGFYRLPGRMKSLKLDAGVLVEKDGLILACSDLARSLVVDRKGKALYALLEGTMLDEAIPAGREGRTGEEVYWAGIRPLFREEKRLIQDGLLPAGASMKKHYDRDIGHTFGKQESTTLFFRKGESRQVLRAGMVSAIEYQWPYRGYALGIEDMFVVGPRRGINITR